MNSQIDTLIIGLFSGPVTVLTLPAGRQTSLHDRYRSNELIASRSVPAILQDSRYAGRIAEERSLNVLNRFDFVDSRLLALR